MQSMQDASRMMMLQDPLLFDDAAPTIFDVLEPSAAGTSPGLSAASETADTALLDPFLLEDPSVGASVYTANNNVRSASVAAAADAVALNPIAAQAAAALSSSAPSVPVPGHVPRAGWEDEDVASVVSTGAGLPDDDDDDDDDVDDDDDDVDDDMEDMDAEHAFILPADALMLKSPRLAGRVRPATPRAKPHVVPSVSPSASAVAKAATKSASSARRMAARRRMSESPPPSKGDVVAERLARRREANQRSAKLSRERKKQHIQFLEGERDRLEQQVDKLTGERNSLQSTVSAMQQELMQYRALIASRQTHAGC